MAYSFRTRVAILLSILVLLLSSVAFYIYSKVIEERVYFETQRSMQAVFTLLKDQYISGLKQNDGKILYSAIKEMKSKPSVENAYLLNSKGEVIFPKNTSLNMDSLLINGFTIEGDDVKVGVVEGEKDKMFRSYINLKNSESCLNCHKTDNENLGYIIVDMSVSQAERNLTFTRVFSVAFTLLIVALVGGTMTVIHNKYVKRSLFHFKDSINAINKGNLHQRLDLINLKELRGLGVDFNSMLDNFQKTQNELLIYHERELKNSKKLASVGEMAARLAHEIRNPMTGIANAVEIIVEELKDGQNKAILEEVKRQADRVNGVISSLLVYSASKKMQFQEANLNELIESLVFFFNSQKYEKEIKVIADLQYELPKFNFDPIQIEKVLLNLGLNSIQSMDKQGCVVFKTCFNPNEKKVIVSVIDDGEGIESEILHDIFSPFYTTKTEGTGLGLAIVQDIVELHNGEVWVESEVGDGTSFYISLPIEDKFIDIFINKDSNTVIKPKNNINQ